jgi:type VI secretion system secreted protein VgrG
VNYIEPVDHEAATFNGIVTCFKRISASREEATYKLRIEPRFAALCKRVHRSDVYKDVTFQEMVTQLLVDRRTSMLSISSSIWKARRRRWSRA